MNISAHSAPVSNARGKWPRPLIIRTTLYDLMTAINAEVGADEGDLAIAAAMHLLATHRLIYKGTWRPRQADRQSHARPTHAAVKGPQLHPATASQAERTG